MRFKKKKWLIINKKKKFYEIQESLEKKRIQLFSNTN